MTLARLGCALLALFASAAEAQTYRDSGGTVTPAFFPLPYGYTPLAPGQHNVGLTAATALTAPGGARYATICATNAAVKYTTDGATTPSALVGQPLAAGACMSLSGPAVLANFRAFSATGILDIEYFQ